MDSHLEELEGKLDEFDPQVRAEALDLILVASEKAPLPKSPKRALNLHAHTFFSYNGYGYSPTCFAWRARKEGLLAAGIVDFDVLDGVDEFLQAARTLGLRATAGIETRIFIPEFADRVINSPGEPGISYNMGIGFPRSQPSDAAFLGSMKAAAQERNSQILERVNPALDPVTLDYERDVIPLTPGGNATERHVCAAYAQRAESVFPDTDGRVAYWSAKLGEAQEAIESVLADPPALQALIRSKTMKAGGVGYVQPDGPSFPRLADVNRFILDCGALPVCAWLDGTSPGEQAMKELLDLHQAAGAAALNIIPDRSWNIASPETKKVKLDNLYAVVELARARDLPIVVGTEMNAYGQRFVDDFDAPELAPLVDTFIEGAYIVYAHTRLQPEGLGYLSDWAKQSFATTKEKNAFFRSVGESLEPGESFPWLSKDTPDAILSAVRA
jgi:hypothetical protein